MSFDASLCIVRKLSAREKQDNVFYRPSLLRSGGSAFGVSVSGVTRRSFCGVGGCDLGIKLSMVSIRCVW